MKRTWIKNARIVNEGKIFHGSIVIENEVIAEVLAEETVPSQPCGEIIDAKGYYLMPGVIDDHVHFRDPGLTHKADIHTESTAAAAGGVTSFMDMPNTTPQTTTLEALNAKFADAATKSIVNYSFYFGATNTNADVLPTLDKSRVCGVKLFMKQPEEPTEFFSTPIADSHDNNDGSENYQDNYDNGGYSDDENDYSDDDTEDNDDASRKKLFAITATITVGILVVVILAIVAGYKIFGFGGTNNKTTTTTKPKTTVADDDDSKGGVFVDTESSAVSTDTNTTTSQPADESSTPATETSAPDTETTTTTTTTASDTETTTTTTTTADSKPDETTTTTSAESGDSAKAVAAITAQIDGKVSSYEYRTEDAGFLYYYFFTEDGHGYSAAYNKADGSVVLEQNY